MIAPYTYIVVTIQNRLDGSYPPVAVSLADTDRQAALAMAGQAMTGPCAAKIRQVEIHSVLSGRTNLPKSYKKEPIVIFRAKKVHGHGSRGYRRWRLEFFGEFGHFALEPIEAPVFASKGRYLVAALVAEEPYLVCEVSTLAEAASFSTAPVTRLFPVRAYDDAGREVAGFPAKSWSGRDATVAVEKSAR